MDQTFAAGLRNLTADEALWQARIDPRRPVSSLADQERDALYRKIQKVLRDCLPYGYVPGKRSWLTGARGHRNGACPRCGAQLERARSADGRPFSVLASRRDGSLGQHRVECR
jgi:formamidopyrimidine-DNA glycosylase